LEPLTIDDMIAEAMHTLRHASPRLTSEALEVVEMVEAEIARRQRERIAASFARWLEELAPPETD